MPAISGGEPVLLPRFVAESTVHQQKRKEMTDVRTITTNDLRQRLGQGTNFEFWNVLTDNSFTEASLRSRRLRAPARWSRSVLSNLRSPPD